MRHPGTRARTSGSARAPPTTRSAGSGRSRARSPRSATESASGTCCSAISSVIPSFLSPSSASNAICAMIGRETRRRLVEHEQPRSRHERTAHREHLLLASAQGSRLLALALLQPREEVVHELQRRGVGAPGIRAEDEIASSGSWPGTGAARPARTRFLRARRGGQDVASGPSRRARPALPSPGAARRWPGRASSCRRRSSRRSPPPRRCAPRCRCRR